MTPAVESVRALIVDDDPEMRSVLRVYLDNAAEGIRVIEDVPSGTEAVAYCSARPPDVVVLDLDLAGVTGLDVAASILDADPTQPIVVFSSYLHPSVVAAADRLGICECVGKDEFRRLPSVIWKHGRARRDARTTA